MRQYKLILFLLLCTAGMAGCKKYDVSPSLADPAYIRVFNNLSNTVDALHNTQAAPFLTFLADPKTDAAGLPEDAAIVGDYLTTRQLFSLSYPINEGNSSVGNGTIGGQLNQPDPPVLYPQNYEYPGNAHVLTATAINGFDLSAWAQITSGKHRIMFVVRPQNSTPFKGLSTAQRSNILVDTTVTLEKGEVYTLEVVSRDLDKSKYGLYIRKEKFIHEAFEANKIYTGFVNLSGKTPVDTKYGSDFFFPDKVKISCTYSIPNDPATGTGSNHYFNPLQGYDNVYYTTLTTKMDTEIPYLALPLLPESAFFYQGIIRRYGNFAKFDTGNMPFVQFTLVDADKPVIGGDGVDNPTDFTLTSSQDPAIYNNYNANTTSISKYTPNLNLVVNTGSSYHIYSTLNIMEMVYDRVYLMQIQRDFNKVPQN